MIKTRLRIRALNVSLIVAAMVLASSATSFAGPLNIPLDTIPVMNAQSITSILNLSQGLFTATGTAVGFNTGSGNTVISQPFKLIANFSNGDFTSASLVIGSEAAPYVYAGNLIDADWTKSADGKLVRSGTIEFRFGSVSGSSGVFDADGQLDVAIKVSSTISTSFFQVGGMDSLETAVLRQPSVPEPSSLLLMLAGAAGIYGGRRRLFPLKA